MAKPSNRFQKIVQDGFRRGIGPGKSQEARAWYRDQAQAVRRLNPRDVMKNGKAKLEDFPQIGQMYLYFYDPKLKKILPYYDRFPCTIVIEHYNDGFLGMNMHYLPHTLRAHLMDALYDVTTNQSFDERTKLKVSYSILKKASKFKFFEPTIHRYLYTHVQSRFLKVTADEWDTAIFLPLERFEKQSAQHVFAESRRKVTSQMTKR